MARVIAVLGIVLALLAAGTIGLRLWSEQGADDTAPRIGLSVSDAWFDDLGFHRAPYDVSLAQVRARVVTLRPSDDADRIDEVLADLDALLLAGGFDVDPALYGAESGTAKLVDGEARVHLGETFSWVTNPDIGLTAHVTSRSPGGVLYVAEIDTKQIVVRSVEGFADDAIFDYLVYGLRIGFENTAVVQPKRDEAYLPSIFEASRVDRTIDIAQDEAENTTRALAAREGIFCGISSGGAVAAALKLSAEVENAVIVAIICDRGDRYLSTGVFPD